MFKCKLQSILFILQNCDDNRETVFSKSVYKRLEKSLDSYHSLIKSSFNYLYNKNDINIMKNLNRR